MNFVFMNSIKLNIHSLFSLIIYLDKWKKFNTSLISSILIVVLVSFFLTVKFPESSIFSAEFNISNAMSFSLVILGLILFLIATNKPLYQTIKYNFNFSINIIKVFIKIKKRIETEYINYFQASCNDSERITAYKYKFLLSSLLFNNMINMYLVKLNRKFLDKSQGFTVMKNFVFLYKTKNFENFYSHIFFDLKHYKEENPFDYICITIKNNLLQYLNNMNYKDCINNINLDGLIRYIIKIWYSELNKEITKR